MPNKRDAGTRTVHETPMVLMIIMSMAVLTAIVISLHDPLGIGRG
ncbi:MAG TPA: hypothetical protein VMR25_08360 [Planctomycetaceae bacterium]|jgi:hypothetical protein|nr:hypothetical protein [Planctomycetaceae bacterium]